MLIDSDKVIQHHYNMIWKRIENELMHLGKENQKKKEKKILISFLDGIQLLSMDKMLINY
jgi:hypothetical protein